MPRGMPPYAGSGQAMARSAKVAEIHEDYKSILTCPICLDLFVDPHTLGPCGHMVCGPCFFHWEGSNAGPPKCPSCNRVAQQVAKNAAIENAVQILISSMAKNRESDWVRAREGRWPKGPERAAYEERLREWADIYVMIPHKTLSYGGK
ncbi:hypothetical protein DL93DRAFT_1391793 [Clavulina sp. PMI_390]|nr:hypothetical protein DL93DRAFT_1391793 [Clavulina sp. PMI_390]